MLETPGPSSERSEDRSEGSREEEEAPTRRGARVGTLITRSWVYNTTSSVLKIQKRNTD